MNISAFIQ